MIIIIVMIISRTVLIVQFSYDDQVIARVHLVHLMYIE